MAMILFGSNSLSQNRHTNNQQLVHKQFESNREKPNKSLIWGFCLRILNSTNLIGPDFKVIEYVLGAAVSFMCLPGGQYFLCECFRRELTVV